VTRIGIDLGGTKIEGIALTGHQEVARIRVPTPRGNYDATIETIADVVRQLAGQTRDRATVGVGIPGSLDRSAGIVRNANSTWLIGRRLGDDLEQALARPVRIANDANCFAMSEAIDGAGAGERVVFGVIVGTGVGAGVVVNGKILEGPNVLAGEWGHNPLPWAEADEWPGRPCYCGLRGCIETFLSGPALETEYAQLTLPLKAEATTEGVSVDPATPETVVASGFSRTAVEIVELAGSGDAAAEDILNRYVSRLARALASVINLVDPDVIVLGGGMSNVDRLYMSVPALWREWVFGARDQAGAPSAAPVRTRLVRARHGDSSGVRGAAWLWNDVDR
jgi:fructokinase